MALRVRPMTAEEAQSIEQLARSRTAPARSVERARIIRLAREGLRVPAIARELGIVPKTVRFWLKRFNERGMDGLEDKPRPGRAPTYTPEEVGELIGTCLTNPRELGLPFASWTLDRLEAYLNEEKGIAIKRSRIDEILLAEGLRWRTQESWFGERVDPEFAAKRGSSPSSTRKRLRVV
ncbi:MAG: helix-turn-helix domain-containing protein [Chloroflexota bacterium]